MKTMENELNLKMVNSIKEVTGNDLRNKTERHKYPVYQNHWDNNVFKGNRNYFYLHDESYSVLYFSRGRTVNDFCYETKKSGLLPIFDLPHYLLPLMAAKCELVDKEFLYRQAVDNDAPHSVMQTLKKDKTGFALSPVTYTAVWLQPVQGVLYCANRQIIKINDYLVVEMLLKNEN